MNTKKDYEEVIKQIIYGHTPNGSIKLYNYTKNFTDIFKDFVGQVSHDKQLKTILNVFTYSELNAIYDSIPRKDENLRGRGLIDDSDHVYVKKDSNYKINRRLDKVQFKASYLFNKSKKDKNIRIQNGLIELENLIS